MDFGGITVVLIGYSTISSSIPYSFILVVWFHFLQTFENFQLDGSLNFWKLSIWEVTSKNCNPKSESANKNYTINSPFLKRALSMRIRVFQ